MQEALVAVCFLSHERISAQAAARHQQPSDIDAALNAERPLSWVKLIASSFWVHAVTRRRYPRQSSRHRSGRRHYFSRVMHREWLVKSYLIHRGDGTNRCGSMHFIHALSAANFRASGVTRRPEFAVSIKRKRCIGDQRHQPVVEIFMGRVLLESELG